MPSQAQKHAQPSDVQVLLRKAAIAVALTLPAIAAQAQQVYKWVDAEGRVQYSERKPTEPGAAARATELKPPPLPQPPPPPVPRPLRPMPPPLPTPTPPANTDRPHAVFPQPPQGGNDPPPALSRGLNRETDAYKCALARDILNGSVRRVFGGPMDDNDRQIARGDIRLFCK